MTARDPADRPPSCPGCGAVEVIPIVYGEPGPELAARAARREIVLGGCILDDDAARWFCRACRAEFGSFSRPAKNPRKRR